MKSAGRLSNGIRLGWQAGFDSGRTLDYIYENKPRGCTPLGRRWIAPISTASAGAASGCARPICKTSCATPSSKPTAEGRAVRLLDIASGPGRYVLETIRDQRQIPMTAVLRDYKAENVGGCAADGRGNGIEKCHHDARRRL